MADLYDILGAAPDASPEEIRKRYLKAALASHPDKHPNDPSAAARFRDVRKAWLVLSDESQRLAYDARRRRTTPGGASNITPEVRRARARQDAAKAAAAAAADDDDDDDEDIWEGTWEDLSEEFEFVDDDPPSWEDLWRDEQDSQRAGQQRALRLACSFGLTLALLIFFSMWRWVDSRPLAGALDIPLRTSAAIIAGSTGVFSGAMAFLVARAALIMLAER